MNDSSRHVFEHLLGLPRSFLSEHGDWSLQFNAAWPKVPVVDFGEVNWLLGLALIAIGGIVFFSKRFQFGVRRIVRAVVVSICFVLLLLLLSGSVAFNLALGCTALLLVLFVYSRDGRSGSLRIGLGAIRSLLFALILFLLNKPVLTVVQSQIEPSVLAILVDDSSSMRVPDAGSDAKPQTRLSAAQSLVTANLKQLAGRHNLRLYKFDRDASPLAGVATNPDLATATKAIDELEPVGDSTQVLPSILTALHDLQGQRVAGVVVLTDGRDTPAHNITEGLEALKDFGTKIFPIALGSDNQPKNIEVQNIELDDVAFTGDVVNVRAMVRATGYEPNHPVHLLLKDRKTGAVLLNKEGKPSELTINVPDDKPVPVELQWQTTEVGTKEIVVEAEKQPGELDVTDNTREAMVSVLDARIAVLFVDGYPRWDYRYLKNALLRDKTVDVSCLLASADFNFMQEGNKPLPSAGRNSAGHFPDTLAQLLEYDVIVLGDVDPRYFTDSQLQLMNEFVNRGGGFEMVAGERYSPQAYRNTPIEPLLPVSLAHVEETDPNVPITQGFRPSVTKVGDSYGMFHFFSDRQKNSDFLDHLIPELFWYCHGITAKPSVGEVLAEHPTDLGPDGHKAPLLVAGRFGGRTLFSAIDDSWRWRFYTDEPVFDTYWVQQLRYLARNRKIGQRRLTLTADQPVYELGGQVRLLLRVIDPGLARQLPEQIRVEITDSNGQPARMENLVRQDGSGGETFAGSYTADKVGKFTVHLPPVATGVDMIQTPLEVTLPKLELTDPRVDRVQLSRLAAETLGRPIDLANAAQQLADIPSVQRDEPKSLGEPLWNAPVMMALFVLLIVGEWVVRKLNGLV